MKAPVNSVSIFPKISGWQNGLAKKELKASFTAKFSENLALYPKLASRTRLRQFWERHLAVKLAGRTGSLQQNLPTDDRLRTRQTK